MPQPIAVINARNQTDPEPEHGLESTQHGEPAESSHPVPFTYASILLELTRLSLQLQDQVFLAQLLPF
jgi:hypothetical protein